MSDKKVFDFEGKEIDVHWDGRLCIHIAECGQSEGDLFVAGRNPWCIPDQSTPGEVAEICERCPSGALTYSHKSGTNEQPAPANSVHVSYNGPYFVQGDLDIQDVPDDMPGVRFRAALCRCGKSSNKPFCDNSHLEAGFEDHGAIGERGIEIQTSSGKLTITPAANGPLILSGNVILFAGSGRVAWKGDKVALCRCGASKNKPFCDGSHKEVGFSS